MDNQQYDTAIKDIGGIKDHSSIQGAVKAFFAGKDSFNEFVYRRNGFEIRTEAGRKKAAWAVEKNFLSFSNDNHRELIAKLFEDGIPMLDQNYFLFWNLCLNNKLVRELSIEVFSKNYFSGRAGLSKDDIIGYVKAHVTKPESSETLDWSEETVYRVSTKYLSLMTKFGFLEGKRQKSFNHLRVSTEAQVVFLYFVDLCSGKNTDILKNPMFPLLFLTPEDSIARLKKLSMKGFFEMNYNGASLNIHLTHNYQDISDVLYN